MTASSYKIDVDVLQEVRVGGYRLKVSILNLGLYISGWLVYKSPRRLWGWDLKPPYYTPCETKDGKPFHPIEFNKHEHLWLEIDEAVAQALHHHKGGTGRAMPAKVAGGKAQIDRAKEQLRRYEDY